MSGYSGVQQVRHDDLADLSVGTGRPGARAHDLDDQPLVHDQAFAGPADS